MLGLPRRRREEIFSLITRATGPRTECPVGITARERPPPKTLVQEATLGRGVVHSDERLAYERAMQERAMERPRALRSTGGSGGSPPGR